MRKLAQLLGTFAADDFVAGYWGKRTLHIPGFEGKFEDFFGQTLDVGFLKELLDRHSDRLDVFAFFPHGDDRVSFYLKHGVQRFKLNSPREASKAIDMGASVAVYCVEDTCPQITRMALKIKSELSHAGNVYCTLWWASDSAQSEVLPHIDPYSNIFKMQLMGQRAWKLSDVPEPGTESFYSGILRPDGVACLTNRGGQTVERKPVPTDRELVMKPGDLLCLPAGTWHSTRPVAGEPSLSLNFSFQDANFRAFMATLLTDVLSEPFDWKEIPVGAANADGSMSDEAAEFLRGRLSRVRAKLDSLGSDDLNRVWNALISSQTVSPPASRWRSNRLRRGDRFQINPTAALRHMVSHGEVYLFHAGRMETFPVTDLPFIVNLIEKRAFEVSEAIPWTQQGTFEAARDMIQKLMKWGALVRE